MKTKYSGITSIVILAASLALIGLYYLQAAQDQDIYEETYRFRPVKSVKIPGSREMKRIKRMNDRMSDLAYPKTQDITPVNLGLFDYYTPGGSGAVMTKGPEKRPETVLFDYTVTFAFFSNSGRYCVVNGKFYTEGSTLPDNGKILRIESNKILVLKKDLSKWIEVTSGETSQAD